jgi:hypothetical protein
MKKKSSKAKAKGKVSIKDLTVKAVKGAGVKGGVFPKVERR